jgi:hypothetical protein
MPTPVLVIIALVAGLTPNSSATNLMTAVNGAPSGTESLHTCQLGSTYVLKGSFGSDAFVILKVTFC